MRKVDPFSSLRGIWSDRSVLVMSLVSVLSYLPESGQSTCFFVYLTLVLGKIFQSLQFLSFNIRILQDKRCHIHLLCWCNFCSKSDCCSLKPYKTYWCQEKYPDWSHSTVHSACLVWSQYCHLGCLDSWHLCLFL